MTEQPRTRRERRKAERARQAQEEERLTDTVPRLSGSPERPVPAEDLRAQHDLEWQRIVPSWTGAPVSTASASHPPAPGTFAPLRATPTSTNASASPPPGSEPPASSGEPPTGSLAGSSPVPEVPPALTEPLADDEARTTVLRLIPTPEVLEAMAAIEAGTFPSQAPEDDQTGTPSSSRTVKDVPDQDDSHLLAAQVHRLSHHTVGAARPPRTGTGVLGRLAVLLVLALVTVVAPLSSRFSPFEVGARASFSASQEDAVPESSPAATSVAAAVLGSDADVDPDTELSNVPDAATLARIREAYAKAKTCSPDIVGAASGDAEALSPRPQLFNPMIEGTYTVSSPYGYRLHPTLGTMKLHAGQDYAAPVGTPIYAVASGTVVSAGMIDDTGTVTIEHEIDGVTWYSSYLHMYEDGIYVKEGDQVQAGQLIAGVGSTGRSTGAHLHFEIRTKNDTADESTVDPAAWLVEHGAVELTTTCS